jgi:acyl-CoA thioesterase FadM
MAKKDGNYGYLKRQANNRQPRETFLIVCEGEKTEYYYFTCLREDLKSNNIKIKVKGEGQNTLSLVKKAINIKNNEKSASYDQVWCVFDKDNYTKEQFNQAEGLAKEENIGFVVRRCEIEYISPAILDNEIEVSVAIKEFSFTIIKIYQEIKIYKKILSTLNVDLACINLEKLKPHKISQNLKDLLNV